MKTISVGTMKGGVGKTAVIFNLAGFLIKEGKRVLIIDADAQGNTSESLGWGQLIDGDEILNDNSESESFEHLLLGDIEPSLVINPTIGLGGNYIHLIPSNVDLTMVESNLIYNSIKNGLEGYKILSNWIKKNNKYLSERFDYILCDVGPNIGVITQNCLYASDEIYEVTDIGVNSFRGAKLLYAQWQKICDELKIENKIKGLIINKVDKTNVCKKFIPYIRKQSLFKDMIFNTTLPSTVKFRNSESEGIPLAFSKEYDVIDSSAYESFFKLMKEMKQKGFL